MSGAADEAQTFELRNARKGRTLQHETMTKAEAALRNRALRGLSFKWVACKCPNPPDNQRPPQGRRELADDE